MFDLDSRRTVDREAAHKGIDFMERSARAGRPFFLFYPITQIHFPTLAHPDFAGKTGAGDIGDAMADVDHNVGLILAGLERLGLERDTMVLWCTDNGAEGRRPWRGSSGPWRGFYNTVMEGGIRTPCVIRWPGRIPAGRISNEIVHEMDLFPTLAAAAGITDLPADRAIDGIDVLPFLEGKRPHSGRESALFFTGTQVRAVKWKEWKFHYAFMPEPRVTEPPLMRLFNLRSDPREETDIKDVNPWALAAVRPHRRRVHGEPRPVPERAGERPGSLHAPGRDVRRAEDPLASDASRSARVTDGGVPPGALPRGLDLERVRRLERERLPDLDAARPGSGPASSVVITSVRSRQATRERCARRRVTDHHGVRATPSRRARSVSRTGGCRSYAEKCTYSTTSARASWRMVIGEPQPLPMLPAAEGHVARGRDRGKLRVGVHALPGSAEVGPRRVGLGSGGQEGQAASSSVVVMAPHDTPRRRGRYR